MIAGLVAGSFQPQPRASATEATFREIAGLDLPEATEADIAQGFMSLANHYEEINYPLASRGATVREIADLLKDNLLQEDKLGNLRNAEKVWRAVAAHYAQLPDGRSQAIAATWLREADMLEHEHYSYLSELSAALVETSRALALDRPTSTQMARLRTILDRLSGE